MSRRIFVALFTSATFAACGSPTHAPPNGSGLGGDLPAIDGNCTTADNEVECRSDVDCAVPGECCVEGDGGACLATCQPCCLYFGSSGDGAQKLKCQTS